MDTIKVQDLAQANTWSSCMWQLALIILFQKSLLPQALLSVQPQPESLVSTICFVVGVSNSCFPLDNTEGHSPKREINQGKLTFPDV